LGEKNNNTALLPKMPYCYFFPPTLNIFGSVGYRVKIHKITPATGKERGDLEIKDYVVLQKPLEQTDRLFSSYLNTGLHFDGYSIW
jgi:hypothetical protein